MKRKFLTVLALAAAGVFLLTACASSGSGQKDVNPAVSGAGNGSSDAGTSSAGNGSSDAGTSGVGNGSGDAGTSGAGNGSSDAGTSGAGNGSSDAGTSGAGNGSSAAGAGKDEAADASDASQDVMTEDVWSGSYAGDQESVSIRLNEDGTLQFSFAQSGISGTADVDGNQAVYNGDDGHILTFSKSQGMLKVVVSNSEGYDSSDSPLNGTYVPSY